MRNVAVVIAVACIVAFAGAARADAVIVPEREEIGPDERMLVQVRWGEGSERGAREWRAGGARSSLRLGWMDHDGERLHDALVRVEPGVIDLAEVIPDVRSLREVSYVQLFADGRPVGAALVVQPMLERIMPRTVEGYRADGSVFPRVTGWRTKKEIAEMAREEKADDDDDDDADREEGERGDQRGDHADEEEFDPERPPVIDRGRDAAEALADPSRALLRYRMYVERDVVLDTSFGEIRILLRPDQAPETAWNFRELVRRGFYDGQSFYRIVPMTVTGDPFVIQAGDPTGEGLGGPGYELPLEPSGIAHDFGVISMARSDEVDSAGSQFFIALSRAGTAALDGQYCAFGYAVTGREAILAIADVPLVDVRRGTPRWPVVIHEAFLVDASPRETGRGRVEQRVQRDLPEDDDRPRPPRRVPR